MKRGAFIQSNAQQVLGAKIAKHALETKGGLKKQNIPITIIEVEKVPAFRAFVGKPYRYGKPYSFESDLQSFTLTRFMPPELMGYEGRALVIDPDIFALADITELFDMDMHGAAITACKKNPWDTSVMVLECAKLAHWKIADMLSDIASGKRIYEDIAQLRSETASIRELSRTWNNLDTLTPETKMLHTTMRLTQPWKTGLPIDFTFNPVPKLFGIIPRFWVHHPTRYQPHPNKEIERLFFSLAKDALAAGAITKAEIQASIEIGNIRADVFELIAA